MKTKRKYWYFLLFAGLIALILRFALSTQKTLFAGATIGDLTSQQQTEGNVMIFNCGEYQVRVELCTVRTVRVQLSASGSSGYRPADPQYYMVQKNIWAPVAHTVSDEGSRLVVKTSALELRIEKRPFRIGMYDLEGQLLSKDTEAVGMYKNGNAVGVRKEEGIRNAGGIFGFGSGDHGRRSGLNRYEQDFGDFTMSHGRLIAPFFMSTVGYGIFLNTIEKNTVFYKHGGGFETQGYLDYYFFYGPDFKTILNEYAEVTGRMELYGKWAHGFMLSKYGNDNATQEEFLEWIHRLRNEGYPTDCYVFDYGWRGDVADNGGNQSGAGEKWGKQMWNNDITKFPDIDAMFREARELGFHVGLHNNAGTPEASGGTQLYDPEVAAPWIKSYMDSVITTGYGDWFWPDEFDVLGSNTAPTFSSKGAYEAWQDYTVESRPMFVTRGSYAGQHFATAWSGDIENTSEELISQIGYSLDAGLVGYWTVSHDLGGFMRKPSDELYTRWVAEFGAWNGLMRTHGHGGREPWLYNATAQETLKKNLRIRYALYPYIYSTAWQGYSRGTPMMRAMILEDGSQYNADAWALNQQYYFGDWFLVAPAADTTDTVVSVWLPPETVWYDRVTGERYEGGQAGKTIRVAAALDEIPVFIKAGAIIPMGPDMDYADEKPLDPLTLDIYPAGTSSYTLYEDDGVSRRYITENAYTTTTYTCSVSGNEISFRIGARENGNAAVYTPEARSYNLKFNHIGGVNGVSLGGKQLGGASSLQAYNAASEGYYYDDTADILYVKVGDTGEEMLVKVDSEGLVEPDLGKEEEGLPPQRVGDGDSYELENAEYLPAEGGSVETKSEWKGYTGTGYAAGFTAVGDALEFDVNVLRDGVYDLKLRVNCGKKSINDNRNRTAKLTLDGTAYDLTIQPTAVWGDGSKNGEWKDYTIEGVKLTAGLHKFRLSAEGSDPGNYNFDRLTFDRRDTSKDAFAEIPLSEADDYDNGSFLGDVFTFCDGGWAQFDELRGAHRGGFVIRVRSSSGGKITVFENGVGDKILTTVELPRDGIWHEFEVDCKDTDAEEGSIFLQYTGEGGTAEAEFFRFIRKIDAFSRIAAVDAAERVNINVRDGVLVNIYNNSRAKFADLDFGSGAGSVALTAASANSGGEVRVYLDEVNAANLIATVYVTNTGSWSQKKTFYADCSASGVHDVWFEFRNSTSSAICDFSDFRFSPRPVSVKTEVTGGTADVQVSDVTAEEGSTVIVQITGVQAGLNVQEVSVVDGAGKQLDVLELTAGAKYSYVQPSGKVTVRVILGEKLPEVTHGAVLELEDGNGATNDAMDALRIDREWTGFTGTGYVAGWKNEGCYVTVRAEVKERGLWTVTLRGAAGKKNEARYDNTPRLGALYLDNAKVSAFGLEVQQRWDTWVTVTFSVALDTGVHEFKIVAEGETNAGNFNLDRLEFSLKTDRSALSERLAQADALKDADFERESWMAFIGARTEARSVFGDPTAEQDRIDGAEEALAAAIGALVPKDGPSGPSGTDDPADPPKAPKNGLSGGAIAGIVVGSAATVGLAAALTIVFRKKKHRK